MAPGMWQDYQKLKLQVDPANLIDVLSAHIEAIVQVLMAKRNCVFTGSSATLMCGAVLTTISAVDPLAVLVQLERVRGQLTKPNLPTSGRR